MEKLEYLDKYIFLYDLEGTTDKCNLPGWKADTHCLTQAKFLLSPLSAGGKCLMPSPLCCWPAEHTGLPLWDALTALHSLPTQGW